MKRTHGHKQVNNYEDVSSLGHLGRSILSPSPCPNKVTTIIHLATYIVLKRTNIQLSMSSYLDAGKIYTAWSVQDADFLLQCNHMCELRSWYIEPGFITYKAASSITQ